MTATQTKEALTYRFGDTEEALQEGLPETIATDPTLRGLAARRSHRAFKPDGVDPALVRSLCALALCAPSKSDLQQRDIVIVEDAALRAVLNALMSDQAWVADAPALLVFCGNNRRQRLVHDWRGRPFVNDHLDAFFNATVDAGIALAAFMIAAETVGLGCCPISTIRNRAAEVAKLLDLPDHVFPVAGLGLGWPAEAGEISPRLPLGLTVHTDRYRETGWHETIRAYDRRRAAAQPFARQRYASEYGLDEDYGWSEDKARQYSKPERTDFGAYVRRIGFDLS